MLAAFKSNEFSAELDYAGVLVADDLAVQHAAQLIRIAAIAVDVITGAVKRLGAACVGAGVSVVIRLAAG